ncbi:MAG: TetR/AcrR family transcriptional regulator [Kribbellaceae bacterium]|nr:TetR/AcrR family transcriptional regulator [Kribbellaceae bacterium]
MVRGESLRDRIAAGIVEAAAALLTERPDASMADIAVASGVGRATLYRYFPSRDDLLADIARIGFEELCARVAEADVASVGVEAGLARLTRAFLAAGPKYMAVWPGGVVSDRKRQIEADEADRKLAEPVRELLRRGVAEGTIRSDIPVSVLFELYTALLERSLVLVIRREQGAEQAASAVLSVFLGGVAARHG